MLRGPKRISMGQRIFRRVLEPNAAGDGDYMCDRADEILQLICRIIHSRWSDEDR
jgi:hypothetical protein